MAKQHYATTLKKRVAELEKERDQLQRKLDIAERHVASHEKGRVENDKIASSRCVIVSLFPRGIGCQAIKQPSGK